MRIKKATQKGRKSQSDVSGEGLRRSLFGVPFFKVSDARRYANDLLSLSRSGWERGNRPLLPLTWKNPWVKRESKEIMPDGPRLPLEGSSLPRHWILHQRNADVFAPLRALFSLSPGYIFIVHLYSAHHLLCIPFFCRSHSQNRNRIPFRSHCSPPLRSRRSISTFRYPLGSPTSPIPHLSMLQ